MHFRANAHRRTMVAVVVYLGLLPALLFSSGEGIRLVPFPDLQNAPHEVPAQEFHTGSEYQKNARRIFNDNGGGQNRISKKQPQQEIFASVVGYSHLSAVAASLSDPTSPLFPAFSFALETARSPIRGRAPPFV